MLDLFLENHIAILLGFKTTMFIFLISVIIWITWWIIWAYSAISSKKFKTIIDIIYLFFISIPIIILLFWFHYPLQIILDVNIDPIYTVILSLWIINILWVYKIIYNKLEFIQKKYSEFWSILWIEKKFIRSKIEYPLLFRKSINEILSYELNILHMTLFASLIWVNDIFRIAHKINASSYQTVEIYTFIWIIFLFISLTVHLLIYYLKKKYNYDYSW